MRQLIRQMIAVGLFIAFCPRGECVQLGKLVGAGKAKRYLSIRYGFSVPVPPAWFVSTKDNTPFYFNFIPSSSRGGGSLPIGGATLNIVAQDDLPSRRGRETLSSWAETDADSGDARSLVERAAIFPSETNVERALWTAFDLKRYSPDDQAQHQVNIYWEFRNHLFATHLIYLNGDPHAKDYNQLLDRVMRGIRPADNN